MNNRISRINKYFSVLVALIVASQGLIQAHVVCIESDGNVNLELDCELWQCEINTIYENNQVDQCQECIDIPLEPNTSVFKQAVRADNWNLALPTFDLTTQTIFINEQFSNCIDPTQKFLYTKTQPQLAIKSTRLLL